MALGRAGVPDLPWLHGADLLKGGDHSRVLLLGRFHRRGGESDSDSERVTEPAREIDVERGREQEREREGERERERERERMRTCAGVAPRAPAS